VLLGPNLNGFVQLGFSFLRSNDWQSPVQY
jgi:hypothetical protein